MSMDNKQFAERLAELCRGELDLRSEAGQAVIRYAEDSLKELRDVMHALIDANVCLSRRLRSERMMRDMIIRIQDRPTHLEVTWNDGSVSRIDADGYDIIAVGDRDMLTPYRWQKVYGDGMPLFSEWTSMRWVDGAAPSEEAGDAGGDPSLRSG